MELSRNRRIALNVVATYGRSLFALACGLFTSRWMLLSLGQTDFGLFGVVGGLITLVEVVNMTLRGAVQRFYAFGFGAGTRKESVAALEEARTWFSVSCAMHFVVATVLIAVGYCAGIWAVRSYLSIPTERVAACEWVFRFSCIGCYVGMVSVPFSAMYAAKQYIAELTVYSFAQTLFRAAFLFYMVTHAGDWLALMAFWTCVCNCVPQILIAMRAVRVFPECRFRKAAFFDFGKMRRLGAFAGWNFIGTFGSILSVQGMGILVNKVFGPVANGALSVSTTVKGQVATLSSAMQGAFAPVITAACGAGDIDMVRALCIRISKFASLLVLVFAAPLFAELPHIMRLWLKHPPEGAALLCGFALATLFVDALGAGARDAVFATGRIAGFTIFAEGAFLLVLPIAGLLLCVGCGLSGVGLAYLSATALNTAMRVWFARRNIKVGIARWGRNVLLPAAACAVAACIAGMLPSRFAGASMSRIAVSTVCSEAVLLSLAWLFLFDADERGFASRRVGSWLAKTGIGRRVSVQGEPICK